MRESVQGLDGGKTHRDESLWQRGNAVPRPRSHLRARQHPQPIRVPYEWGRAMSARMPPGRMAPTR